METRHNAYVELTLPDSTKAYLKKIVEEITTPEDYYKSEVVPHINGDVTAKAHLTFFYGLDPILAADEKLNQLIESYKVNKLKLGDFILMNGYQNLYKILCIQVIDENRELNQFVNKIRKFSLSPNSYEFKPHITLAYVNFDYNLPENRPALESEIETGVLQFSV